MAGFDWVGFGSQLWFYSAVGVPCFSTMVGPLSKEQKDEELKPKPFNLLELMVYPTDPVQTIENFFDLSFMVKERDILIEVDDTGLPLAVASDRNKVSVEKKQMVLSINMKELRELSSLLYPDVADKTSRKRKSSGSARNEEETDKDDHASLSQSFTVPYPKHPLFRSDKLYKLSDVKEQTQLLAEEAIAKQKIKR
eukprot:gene34055-44003_t